MIGLFKTILKIVKKIVLVIYKILKTFRIQFLTLTLIFALILYLAKVIPDNLTMMIVIYIALGLSLIYAVISNYNRLKKPFSKKKKEEINNKDVKQEKNNIQPQLNYHVEQQNCNNNDKISEVYPKYFNVRQNSNYIMAEYKDRYELFLKKDGNLIKIRTDYKRDLK